MIVFFKSNSGSRRMSSTSIPSRENQRLSTPSNSTSEGNAVEEDTFVFGTEEIVTIVDHDDGSWSWDASRDRYRQIPSSSERLHSRIPFRNLDPWEKEIVRSTMCTDFFRRNNMSQQHYRGYNYEYHSSISTSQPVFHPSTPSSSTVMNRNVTSVHQVTGRNSTVAMNVPLTISNVSATMSNVPAAIETTRMELEMVSNKPMECLKSYPPINLAESTGNSAIANIGHCPVERIATDSTQKGKRVKIPKKEFGVQTTAQPLANQWIDNDSSSTSRNGSTNPQENNRQYFYSSPNVGIGRAFPEESVAAGGQPNNDIEYEYLNGRDVYLPYLPEENSGTTNNTMNPNEFGLSLPELLNNDLYKELEEFEYDPNVNLQFVEGSEINFDELFNSFL